MANYLITGGAGFIGSNLAQVLVEKGDTVVIVDDLSMGSLANICKLNPEQVTVYQKSITDHEFMCKLLVNNHFDYLVLLGAVASVADSVARPIETHAINCEANLNVFDVIRKHQINIKKIFFASSAAVYGNGGPTTKQETSLIDPLSPYAIDKFTTERYLLNYGKLYGLNTVAARFFNVYGPKQNPNSPYSGVLSIINKALTEDSEFVLFGDGEQTRDFVYVQDVIRAVLLLLHNSNINNSVYNIATGKSISLNKVIEIFENVYGKHLKIVRHSARKGDVKDSGADISKIQKLGFQPEYSIQEGLSAYIAAQNI